MSNGVLDTGIAAILQGREYMMSEVSDEVEEVRVSLGTVHIWAKIRLYD